MAGRLLIELSNILKKWSNFKDESSVWSEIYTHPDLHKPIRIFGLALSENFASLDDELKLITDPKTLENVGLNNELASFVNRYFNVKFS